MYGLKGKFFVTLLMHVLKGFISRDISEYFYTVPDSDLLKIAQIEPLFEFVAYCFLFSFVVLFLEILLKNIGKRAEMGRGGQTETEGVEERAEEGRGKQKE